MPLFVRVTLPLAGVNFLNQASRGVVATVSPLIAAEFALTASGLGFLAAMFFATYGLAQLPVGLALDRYGARNVQIALALVAAVGLLISGLADDTVALGFGRALTGLGVSAGLMALLKANSQWYPRERVAAMTGAGVFLGALGGMCATLPVLWLLPYAGWRGSFLVMAGLGVVVALAIAVVMPKKPPPEAPWRGFVTEMRQFGRVFSSPAFLNFAPAVAMLGALNFTFQGLWAGPWLRDVAGYDDTGRGMVLLIFAGGLMMGALVSGNLATFMQLRGGHPMLVPWGAMALAAVLQLLLALDAVHHPVAVGVVWFLFACCGTAGTPGYAAIGQSFGPELAGRVATAINGTMLVLTFFLQNAIGWILDLWPRTADDGWDRAGYSWAFTLTLAMQALLVGWMVLAPRLTGRAAAAR